MTRENRQSDLTEDLAAPTRKAWFKERSRKGHALSYSAGVFGGAIVIFALGMLAGLATSSLFLSSAVNGLH